MRFFLELYKAFGRVSVAIQLQYRASGAIWMIGGILEPTIYLVVWSTVARSEGGNAGGYTPGQFAAYYIDYMKNVMQPSEFIEAIEIPARDEKLELRCYKLCKRFDQDISAVCAAFALRLDGDTVTEICIALGGMAAIPKRALLTEKLLTGGKWDESSVGAAMQKLAEDFTPLSDMRASADYRSRASANLLYRFYLETRSQQPLDSRAVNVFAVSG